MNTQKIMEYEANNTRKFKLLPYSYKRIGIGLLIISIIGLIFFKLLFEDFETIGMIIKKVLIVSLLIISISKDKVEDELTIQLRAHSYSLAFIIGVLYALVQPYANYLVALVINFDDTSYADLGDFQVLIFMLMVQLMFYRLLKATR